MNEPLALATIEQQTRDRIAWQRDKDALERCRTLLAELRADAEKMHVEARQLRWAAEQHAEREEFVGAGEYAEAAHDAEKTADGYDDAAARLAEALAPVVPEQRPSVKGGERW